jgi:hypothetical protein
MENTQERRGGCSAVFSFLFFRHTAKKSGRGGGGTF